MVIKDKKYFYKTLDEDGVKRDTGKDAVTTDGEGGLEQLIKFLPIVNAAGEAGPTTVIYTAKATSSADEYVFEKLTNHAGPGIFVVTTPSAYLTPKF